ncbi:hypothetical protein M4R22_11685 [Acidovorax sp. GBBC 3334]|uniref:hypothetical protein n=1 Tax=Acidovorax sp. GBBC 3334 TaxID=2940496 RepID=UPI002302DD68|nr:hypothetical protein [Acidovorax sp. GBBC 3334]MDA8455423.1 hypothetical protein [Acidovorax sp. GBBC 3334]
MLMRKFIEATNTQNYLISGGFKNLLSKSDLKYHSLLKEANEFWKNGKNAVITFDYRGWSANFTFSEGEELIFETIDIYTKEEKWGAIYNTDDATSLFEILKIDFEKYYLREEPVILLHSELSLHYAELDDSFELRKIAPTLPTLEGMKKFLNKKQIDQ